jgi:uncharacterized membrane protein YdfJ with MMPL/SSD domain
VLRHLAEFCYRRRRIVVVAWIVALVGVSVLGQTVGGDLLKTFSLPGTESQRAFINATVVRLLLVPATMELLGDRNWWFPKWLEWLPRVNVEGGNDFVTEEVRTPEPVGGG